MPIANDFEIKLLESSDATWATFSAMLEAARAHADRELIKLLGLDAPVAWPSRRNFNELRGGVVAGDAPPFAPGWSAHRRHATYRARNPYESFTRFSVE